MNLPAIVGSNLLIWLSLSASWRVCGAADVAADNDWPQLLGPRANGISTESGLLEKWPLAGPPVVWDKTIGTGYGAPSVRGERLVLHHRLGDQEIVGCFETVAGETLFRSGGSWQIFEPYGYNKPAPYTPPLPPNPRFNLGGGGNVPCLGLAPRQH